MVFHFSQAQSQQVPRGFHPCPDGVLAIDDPTLTKVVKVENFDSTNPEHIQDLKSTHRWVGGAGWAPLIMFKEWAPESRPAEAGAAPEAAPAKPETSEAA